MPASAEIRILASPSGQIGPYLALFRALRESGERIVIDGPCLSACTLVVTMVPKSRICVTRRAVLGFHGAWSLGPDGRPVEQPAASDIVLASYPAPIREWITRRGGLDSRVLLLRGKDLAKIYRTCR